MERRAGRLIAVVLLPLAGGGKLWVFGLFSAAVCTNERGAESRSGLYFFKRRPDGCETETIVDRENRLKRSS